MKRRFSPILLTVLLTTLALLASSMQAQPTPLQLWIDQSDNDETPLVQENAYPQLVITFTPVNEAGVPLPELPPAAFTFAEDNGERGEFVFETVPSAQPGISIMLVIDASGPMAPWFEQVRAAVPGLYQMLEPPDESGLITFASRSDGTAVNLQQPFPQFDSRRELNFTNDEGALINLLNAQQIDTQSGTPLYDALYKGVRLTATQAQHRRRAVIVITNGADTASLTEQPASRIANANIVIDEARRYRVPIFTIGLGSQTDAAFLQQAAVLTGGTYYALSDTSSLNQLLADVAQQLKTTYRLTYVARTPADNARHTLTLAVRTNVGTAVEQLDFIARQPAAPVVQQVQVVLLNGTAVDLVNVVQLEGTVTLMPEVTARGELAAVDYYLDDADAPLFTATEPPFSYRLAAAALAPETTHTLRVVARDGANPPRTGEFETTFRVAACDWRCRLAGMGPVPLVVAGLLVLAVVVLIWRRGRVAPTAVSESWQMSQIFTDRPPPKVTAGGAEEGAASAHAREDTHLRLVVSDDRFYLDVNETTIGQTEENKITLPGPGVALTHAYIEWQNGRYLLHHLEQGTFVTKVNGDVILHHKLQDGDQITIGEHELIFKQL